MGPVFASLSLLQECKKMLIKSPSSSSFFIPLLKTPKPCNAQYIVKSICTYLGSKTKLSSLLPRSYDSINFIFQAHMKTIDNSISNFCNNHVRFKYRIHIRFRFAPPPAAVRRGSINFTFTPTSKL